MDLRNYLNLKASLSQSLVQSLRATVDPVMDATEWDLSNIYPRKGLPEVKKPGCSHRARVIVDGPIGDPALGEYVSTAIMAPKFLVSAISRDKPVADHLLSLIKIYLDDIPIVVVDAVKFGEYNTAMNYFSNDLILRLNLGSIPVGSGKSNRCSVPEPVQDCGLAAVIDPARDLTFREP